LSQIPLKTLVNLILDITFNERLRVALAASVPNIRAETLIGEVQTSRRANKYGDLILTS